MTHGSAPPTAARGRDLEHALAALLVPCALLGLALVTRAAPGAAAWIPPCPTKLLTGVPCPLCGSFRVLVHTVALELGQALVLAPVPATLLFVSLAASLVDTGFAAAGRPPPAWAALGRHPRALAVVAAALYGLTLWRFHLHGAP